ncbi:DUF3949 domain-containing protein [Bacillus sp. 1P06AnD]|uniref:DUF3949 domain-containing protein n=1 Tax=Bacillus sp. 1P06AnD TaxID=3132208 RepID=UPI0039A06B30
MSVFGWIIAFYVLFTLGVIPFQYQYVKVLKEMKKKKKFKEQEDMFEAMEFEELVLHGNAQGNLLFLPANLIASLIYRLAHLKKA